jgi:enoyl-CoA hydratase
MIHVEDRPYVRMLTIDRPERRNAVDHDTLGALLAAVTEAPADTRVMVVRGAGGHFCAGADLSGVEDRAFVELLNEVLVALGSATFPTLAAVEGAALGAGTQLAAACDLRCAAADATFGIPAAKLGLMVDQWTVQRLCDLAGQGPARAMLLAAETYSGEQAFGFGFVQRQGRVDEALAWADHIATLAPLTIAGHKVGCNEAEHAHTPSGRYGEAFARAWGSDDLQEGLTAFRERRRPVFGGH